MSTQTERAAIEHLRDMLEFIAEHESWWQADVEEDYDSTWESWWERNARTIVEASDRRAATPEPAPDPHASTTQSVECAVNFATGEFRMGPSKCPMCRQVVAVPMAEHAEQCIGFNVGDERPPYQQIVLLERQRDELADALESLRDFTRRACCGPGQPASGELTSILLRVSEAFRKAGRP